MKCSFFSKKGKDDCIEKIYIYDFSCISMYSGIEKTKNNSKINCCILIGVDETVYDLV